jgi:hypothetical protein
MDNPKPDNIQSQPPERRPEEIQAHPPPPPHEPPPSPDYDFKKRSTWGRIGAWFLPGPKECGTWVLLLVLFAFLLAYVMSFGQVTNKTFSVIYGPAIQATGS